MNTVIVENCKTLFIGRRGENEVTEVVFDFSEWQEQFGAGVIDLYVKRNLDVDAYPVVLSVDGTVATWLVTAADTDVVGNGKIEFVYTVNEKVAKSAVFPFFVGEDIGESSPEPPEHYQSWLEQLTELGAETQANAQAAAQSANEAAESAASAEADAQIASSSASEAVESATSADANAKLAVQSAESADADAKSAAQSASDAAESSASAEEDARAAAQSASNAADSSASAEENAQAAEQSESNAEAWAVGERGGNPVSAGDPTYENNAKYWAENARDAALVKSVNGETGVVELDLDDIPDGSTYARATPAQIQQIETNRIELVRQNTSILNKQAKIQVNGILKGNGNGGISAAVAGIDYLPTSALGAYRSATNQDAIDNAQNQNIDKNTAAINTMQPAATAADIGKALIVKTVADGKPTSYEYSEAGGGGGSALTSGDGIDISNDVISNTQGIEYIVGTQTAATAKWTGVSTDETLKVGKIIAYYLPFAGTSTAATLALTMADGTTTREISLQLKPNATVTTQFPAGSIVILVYDGTYWRVNASYDTDTNTNPTGYCLTNGAVAAKAATCSFGYRGDTNYFPCLFRFANTAADATLAITTYAPEAAPIYVNGARTSATNTFSAGVILFLYYNGAYYCYNDGRFPILVDGAVTSVQEYAAGLLADYRTAAAQDTIDAGKQAKITASGILKGDGAGGVSAAVAGTDYLAPSALEPYRTAADQDAIDSEQDERIEDLEQTTTATTIGPASIVTFNASAADMPLKGLTVDIEPVQSGSGDPSPDNVRPITGWTGVNVFDDPKYAVPINWNQIRTDTSQSRTMDGITTKYDPQTHLITITNNSRTTNYVTGSTQCTVSSVEPIPGHRYALLGPYHSGVCVSTVTDNNNYRTMANVGSIMTMNALTATMFRLRITSSYDFVSAHPVGDVYSFYLNIVDITQLLGEEAAATATYDQIAEMFPNDWYPYNAGEITCVSAVNGDPYQKIAVNWEDEAGTVYGGTFDVVNRKLNSYPYYSSYNGETIIGPWISSMDVYAPGATPTLGAQVVDMGGAATSYDLSDIPEITTILSVNNIWADCGDVTVTYGAYLEMLKASLDRTNSDLANLRACIAPTENGDTASQVYVQGAYFFRNGSFCVALLAIDSGDQFTLGTNYKVVSVAEAILAMSFVILEQPHDVEASIGADGTFSVVARGASGYVWQYWTPNNPTWRNSSATTSDYTLEVTEARYTYRYRCKVTGLDGSVIYSHQVKYVRPS